MKNGGRRRNRRGGTSGKLAKAEISNSASVAARKKSAQASGQRSASKPQHIIWWQPNSNISAAAGDTRHGDRATSSAGVTMAWQAGELYLRQLAWRRNNGAKRHHGDLA